MDRCCPLIHAAYWISEIKDSDRRSHNGCQSLLVDLEHDTLLSQHSVSLQRRSNSLFQRIIFKAIEQVRAGAATESLALPGAASQLTEAYMQFQSTMVKRLGHVDVAAAMTALEDLYGATSTGIDNAAFVLAAASSDPVSLCQVRLAGQPEICCVQSAAAEIAGKSLKRCEVGKKIATAEDLLALLSARVDVLASQLVSDGSAITTKATHAGFADFIMSSTASCSLLKSWDEPCEYALSSQWHWTAELLRCVKAHVEQAAEYHQFWHEVHESTYWLTRLSEGLQHRLASKRVARVERGDVEGLLADLKQTLDAYVQWQTRLASLSERARSVTPLHLRTKPLAARTRGRVLVSYATEELALYEGESLVIVEAGSATPLWRVETTYGQEALVPSVILAVTAPDAAALDSAHRLQQQMLGLWTMHVRLLGLRLVELLSSAFTDVICASKAKKKLIITLHLEKNAPKARNCVADEQQQQSFMAVGESLDRILRRIGKDNLKCVQLTSLWNTFVSLIDGDELMLADADGHCAAVRPVVVAHLRSVEQLLVLYEDFVAYWDAYSTSVQLQQQSKQMWLAGATEFTRFVTTAHYVKFYDVELLPSPSSNDVSGKQDNHAITHPALDRLCYDQQESTKKAAALLHSKDLSYGEACDKADCVSPAESLAEIKKSVWDLNQHWLQVARLLQCQKTHLQNAAAYHQFWHDAQDAKLSLNCLVSDSHGQLPRKKPGSQEQRMRDLITEINEALHTCVTWQSKLEDLSDAARHVAPLPQRVKSGARSPARADALCAYVNDEVSLTEGEQLTVLEADTAVSPLWHVRTADGREARVPSVVVLLPAPDPAALDAASRLHAQLLGLWTASVRGFGQRLAMLLREMLADAAARKQKPPSTAEPAASEAQLQQQLATLCRIIKRYDGFSQKDVAELCSALRGCTSSLTSATAGRDEPDGSGKPHSFPDELLTVGLTSLTEELLQSFEDFCLYYQAYGTEVAASRQPKYITLYNATGNVRYITMAYFHRPFDVPLTGSGFEISADRASASEAHSPIRTLEDSCLHLATTVDKPVQVVTNAAVHLQAAEPGTPSFVAAVGDPGEKPEHSAAEGRVVSSLVDNEPHGTLDGHSCTAAVGETGLWQGVPADRPLNYDVANGLRSPSKDDANQESDGGSGSGGGKSRGMRVQCAGIEETGTTIEQVGLIEEGSYEQGDVEEVSYFESSTKEQQVSTEGVMEAEMEVTTTFVITGVVQNPGAPDEVLLSLQDAFDLHVIDAQKNEYVMRNGTEVVRLTIGEAMEAGYIKMGPKVEKKSEEKIKSAAIITVKTISERYPYKVISAKDTRTGRLLTEDEGVAAGILDLIKHTYRDRAANEVMLIGDAVSARLVDIEYDKNASGVIHEEVSKKFNVHSVYDTRRNERVEFHVAVQRGLIDEVTGSYVNNVTGEKLFAAEAIDKGFISATAVPSDTSPLLQNGR